MTVIAMTREVGSGGRDVARLVAERLGLTLIVHELVEHDLAEHLQVRESAVHHCLEGGATLRDRWQVGTRQLARYTQEEILDLAHKGNVLLRGWGACVLLCDITHVARVRVCAPMATRMRAVMRRLETDDPALALREIERADAAHRRTLKIAYGIDERDPLLYDLVLNTERVSVETCVRLICELVASQEFLPTEASLALLADRVLETHVRIKLRERFVPGTGVSGLRAKADGGRVLLTGTSVHRLLAAEAAKIAGAIDGVRWVDNQIEVVRRPRGV